MKVNKLQTNGFMSWLI